MLRIMTPACFCLTLAIPLSTPVSAQTEAETQTLSRIIDTLCLDMVQALNGCETAVLLTSETDLDAADLLIFSDRRGSEPQSVLAVVRGIAYNGAWFGQSPVLEAGENGALLVAEEQIAIGRTPWMQSLTIVHREGEFLVAGHTYSTYDRIVGGWMGWALAAATSGNIDIDELAHEAFVKAFISIDDYRFGTDFLAWLKQIARNLLLAEFKRRRLATQKSLHYLEFLMAGEVLGRLREQDGLQAERTEALGHCLEQLSQQDQQLIELRYRQGATLKDLALMVGRSPGAVKVSLFGIRERLRQCVQIQLSTEVHP